MITKLQDLERFSPEDIDHAIARNDPDELVLVSITVALSCTDCRAAQEVCLRLSGHLHNKVRGNAIMSLGHLARRFRSLDERTVKPIFESALQETDEYVRKHAQSAADEIHQFLGWTFTGHRYGI